MDGANTFRPKVWRGERINFIISWEIGASPMLNLSKMVFITIDAVIIVKTMSVCGFGLVEFWVVGEGCMRGGSYLRELYHGL